MTTDRSTAPPTTSPSARGRTIIADRVVAKIASAAALEVEGTSLPPSRFGNGRPKASAVVDGCLARISLEVTIDYPAPIRSVSKAIRDRVAERLFALTDLHAKEVDITIAGLKLAPIRTGRVQ